jgi:carbamoyltransferase
VVAEDIVLKIAASIREEFKVPNLCLAGGVALNCVANGKLLRAGIFDQLWIQPAAGDAGGAVGAALAGYHLFLEKERKLNAARDAMHGSYLGPAFSNEDIRQRLVAAGASVQYLDDDELLECAANALAQEKVLGWFQGRMEFGPRSLGGRSILGDPRSSKTQSVMNLKIKYRESFRPFAPSVLREDVTEYFDLDTDSPYMLLVAPVAARHRIAVSCEDQKRFGIDLLNVPRSTLPAITHVDYSARVQTVHADTNPRYYELIRRFKALTGVAVLVNTSFNVRGEPIVCCFMGTEMDELYVGNYRMVKQVQNPALQENYTEKFSLD